MTERTPTVRTVRISDQHLPALAEFFTAVWNPDSSPEEIRRSRERQAAANPVEPGAVPPAFAFLLDDRVVGYISTIPVRLWDGTSETPANWLKGFMVLEEYRNGPVGYSVLKKATEDIGPGAGFVVAKPARRLFEALGYTDLGSLSNDILPLAASRMASRLPIDRVAGSLPPWLPRFARLAQRTGLAWIGGALAAIPFRAWTAAARWRSRDFRVVCGFDAITDRALDELWGRVRPELKAASVRDSGYLRWRYLADIYQPLGIFEDDDLVGLAVVRRPETSNGDGGLKLAVLSDILFPPGRADVARATLSAGERAARAMGSHALLCSASHSAARSAMRRHGFISLPGTVHVLLRSGGLDDLPAEATAWWLTRGDGNSDEGVSL